MASGHRPKVDRVGKPTQNRDSVPRDAAAEQRAGPSGRPQQLRFAAGEQRG